MSGRIRNLKPWPKGVSGNPAGRPKHDITSEIARAVFENNAEAIYKAMAIRILKGDVAAFKVLSDRAYGKVKESIEIDASENIVERLEAGRDGPENDSPPKGRIHLRRLFLRQLHNLLQFGGGPYIFAI